MRRGETNGSEACTREGRKGWLSFLFLLLSFCCSFAAADDSWKVANRATPLFSPLHIRIHVGGSEGGEKTVKHRKRKGS